MPIFAISKHAVPGHVKVRKSRACGACIEPVILWVVAVNALSYSTAYRSSAFPAPPTTTRTVVRPAQTASSTRALPMQLDRDLLVLSRPLRGPSHLLAEKGSA
eukprot:5145164-Prymnesium_polylepis.1